MRLSGRVRSLWFVLLIALVQAALPALHLHEHAEPRIAGVAAVQHLSFGDALLPDSEPHEDEACAVCSVLAHQAGLLPACTTGGATVRGSDPPAMALCPPGHPQVAWLTPATRAPPFLSLIT